MVQHPETPRTHRDGFTLIELMVVLLILGILMAIAIPTFLGTSSGAKDAAGESNLVNAVTNELAFYSNNSSFFSSGDGSKEDPQLPWVTTLAGATTGPQVIVYAGSTYGSLSTAAGVTNATIFIAETLGINADCFVALNDENQTPPTTIYAVTTGGCPSVTGFPGTIHATGQAIYNRGATASWYDNL